MPKQIKYYLALCLVMFLARAGMYAQYTGGNADGFSFNTYTLTTCATPSQFFAYTGGNGDGSGTVTYTLTTCGTPSQFYAYGGGNGDGFSVHTYTLTNCGTPGQFYAYMGGNGDGFSVHTYTLTNCGTPSQFYAYMGGNSDGSASQTYTLTTCGTPSQFYAYMGGNGDGFARDTDNYCPTAPPVASFTSNATTICAGTSVTYSDQSTNSPAAWAWTFQGGNPSTSNVQNPVVTYNAVGTYSVSLVATNNIGSNTVTVTNYITVNAIPTAGAGSDASICTGSSTTLTATGGGTYSWTPATGLSATNISNPVANPTVTTTYSVTVTVSGCSSTDAMTVTVNPIPTASAGGDVAICIGSSTNLSAGGGTSYSWTPSTGLNSTSVSNPVASPTVTTTYSVTVTTAGCSSTDAVMVTVNSLPTPSAGGDVAVCNGTSTNLSASGGNTYTWSPATGLSATNISNPVATPASTTNYTVSVTDLNGCQASDVMTVTVNPLPLADAGANTSICMGGSTNLLASGGNTYTWTPAAGLSATNISNPVANPTVTTVYTVSVTDNNGCQASDVVTITVNSLPVASAGSDVAICFGSSTNLSASGGTSYSWSPSTGLNFTNISNPVASPTVTTIYTVTVTSGACSATDAVQVTVNSLPTPNAGSDVAVCNGTSTNLSASGGNTYTWSPASGLSAVNISNPVATPTATTNYTVSVSDLNGCQAFDVITVTVNPLPPADAGNDVTVCTGNSASLSASGGTTYTWTPATGLSATNISNPVASPTVTTTYTVLVTDNNSCQASDVVTVTVSGSLNANAGVDTSFCFGSAVGLSASGGTTYTWTPSTGLSATNISNPVASHTATVTYTVTAASGACSASDEITVTVNPLPSPTVTAGGPTTFCVGDSVVLTAGAATSYTWSTSASTQTISVLNSGSFYVTVSNAFGCVATSNTVSTTANPLGVATITPNGATTFCQGGSLLLTANAGSGYSWTGGANTQTISVTSSGTYTVSVDDPNGCTVPSPTASIVITVNPNPATPTIVSTGTTTSLCIGDTVVLACDSATSYLWSTGATIDSIVVSTPGIYSVTVFNSFGCSTSSSAVNISVNTPLTDFVADSFLVFIPNAIVSFTATVNGIPPYTYLWNFGDGSTSGATQPTHTYTTIGYDTVSLTVIDSAGCSNTITKNSYIEVEQLFPSTPMNTGTALNLGGVHFQDAETGIIALPDGNCILSVDSGNNWTPLPTGQANALQNVCVRPGNWFASGDNGTILLSTNNGLAWTPFATGTTETLTGIHLSAINSGFASGTNGTLLQYNGSAWTPQVSGTTENLNNVFEVNGSVAFAAGNNQTILAYNGVSWSAQTCPLVMDVKDIRFTSPLFGYAAGTNGNVLQTANGGNTWTPSLTGVDINFNSLEAVGPDSAWATGEHGIVYTTTDAGANWIRWSVGYTDDQSSLRITSGKGHVVGSGGNGRNFAPSFGNSIFNSATPANFFKAYPNPAKDECVISGYLAQTEKLTIDVKDVQGRLLEKVINSNVFGAFEAKVNTSAYVDGIYFFHVQQGRKSWVQKIVIAH